MNHEKIDRMKQEYEQIEVPEALKTQVEAGIRKGKRETQKGSIRFLKGAATVAAAMVALVISVNVSPTIAHAMEEVPLLGTIVKVVNFSTYSDVQDDKNMEANVDIPQVAVTNQDGKVLSDETDELNQEVKKYAGGIIKSYQSDLKSASASEKIQLQTQILTAQTTIKKDQYTIKSNKESIKLLEKNIKDATVKSKMNGLVKKVNASLETSSSDDSSDDGSDSGDGSSDDSSYMTILAVGNYRIKGTVSETNVWSLNEGDPVIVRSRVDNSQTWKGTISSIKTDTTADDTSDSSSDYSDGYTDDESSTGETASKYNFYVKLDNDKDLMMGQHVLIEQDNGQDEQKEGMWLPSAYIKKNNNKYYVWLDSHNKLKLHEIQVGEYDENLDEYEVKSGLKTSDYIACDDSTLKEGMKVTKVSPEDNTSGYGDEQENDDAESFGSDASEDTSDVGEDYSDYSDSADTYDSSDDESLSDGADFGSDSSDSGNSGTSDSDIADFGE